MLNGTTTGGVGELSNLCGSCVFILTAALIYKKDHTKTGALKGLLCAALVTSVLYVFMNAYVMFPLYGSLYGMSTEAIVAMGSKVAVGSKVDVDSKVGVGASYAPDGSVGACECCREFDSVFPATSVPSFEEVS